MKPSQSPPAGGIFSHLDPAEADELMKKAHRRRYQAGEWLAQYGDVWPYLFLVERGEVAALKESFEGRSLMLTSIRQGEVFWGLAFFIPQAPMPASLQASKDCELMLWTQEGMLPLLMKDGRLAWELSRLMIQRVQLASEIVEKLAFQPVGGRLARLLVEFAGDNPPGPVARNLTLDEMAARIGSTREVVCRFLHRFSDQGLIEITRTEFSIKDREGLEEFARQMKG
jgi:CRP/FNR family transcriptional regulator